MREIKFRAWDKIHENMLLWKELLEKFDPYEEDGESNLDFILEYQGIGEEDRILMQFTGLHDKNSKEIYEGDIVRRENGTLEENRKYGKVVSYDASDNLWAYFYPFAGDEGEYGNEVVVIGNIYENPELLKE